MKAQEANGVQRARVLFCAEDASLAHVGRVLALATALPVDAYDVTVACGTKYAAFVEAAGLRRVDHDSAFTAEIFSARLARGLPLFDFERLQRCVRDDVELLVREQPDVVVGDFRPSLGISAELVGVPYANMINAYWSPACTLPLPCPELPGVRALGVTLSTSLLRASSPIVFQHHAAAFSALRRAYGLPRVAHSLRGMYTHGGWTLYADLPELVPTRQLAPNHRYIGPVLWEPQLALPAWWKNLPLREDRPLVYVTVGSSGDGRMLEAIVNGVRDLDITLVIATADKAAANLQGPRTFVASFVPGIQMCKLASVVVCNGGSGSVYQALGAGVPVVGIASNMDQYFSMQAVERTGAGTLLRFGKLSAAGVRTAVRRALATNAMRTHAAALARAISRCDAAAAFREILDKDILRRSVSPPLRPTSSVAERYGAMEVSSP